MAVSRVTRNNSITCKSGRARAHASKELGSASTTSANSGGPSTCARSADVIEKRAMYANDVVSPHKGHGRCVQ
jgi:hypothetical protein